MATYTAMQFSEFIQRPEEDLLEQLKKGHIDCMGQSPSNDQQKAWISSVRILKDVINQFCSQNVNVPNYNITFEYELPRERGRRPDVLLIFNSSIVVIEFKESKKLERAYIDQVSAYARDLNQYHEFSHDLSFSPVLLMANLKGVDQKRDDVTCLSSDNLLDFLNKFWLTESSNNKTIDLPTWLEGDYLPLPSLVQAARAIFKHEPLPNIRRASSAGIPETLNTLHVIAKCAMEKDEHHLALITGVAGAGKTLVGITFVHDKFGGDDFSKMAIFLSGNGPLVKVLQYALKSTVFIKDVHSFLKQYGGKSKKIPSEFIFIYDEAQRAWDKEKVYNSPRKHDKSEPEDFLNIGQNKRWCLMIGLIGEGQEIHLGEEGGIEQWSEAMSNSSIQWRVNCPNKLKKYFKDHEKINIHESLSLTESLRTHLAEDVQNWINELIDGNNIDNLKHVFKKIKEQKFDIYLTRNLDEAKKYVIDRYANEPDKRYGLLASSKADILLKYGIKNDFWSTQKTKVGPWFIDDRDSPYSSCQFNAVMTEFGCQGLELDFPIVCWGNDLVWTGSLWKANKSTRGAKDSYQLRKNSYRVLLSRGRDGIIIFIPKDESLNSTYDYLKSLGPEEL